MIRWGWVAPRTCYFGIGGIGLIVVLPRIVLWRYER